MFKQIEKMPYIASGLCGVVYAVIGVAFWGVYPIISPVNDFLLAALIKGGRPTAYYLSIYSHDLAVNVLLAMPFALFISKIAPEGSWKYVWMALGTALVLQYWRLFADPVGLKLILSAWKFYAGLFLSAISLPLAFLIVVRIRLPGAAAEQAR